MNIWILNHYAIDSKKSGGTRHFTFAKWLVKHGHQVTIIAANVLHNASPGISAPEGGADAISTEDGVRFVRLNLPNYTGNSGRRLLNMAMYLVRTVAHPIYQEIETPDVVVGSTPSPFAALAGRFLAWRFSSAYVYEIRDLWPESLVDIGRVPKWHPVVIFFALISRLCIKTAHRIITLLPNAEPRLRELGAPTDRIHRVPNGVDLALAGDWRPELETQVFQVMYAGAFGHANALDIVMQAADVLKKDPLSKNILIRLVGSGPEERLMSQLVERHALSNVRIEAPVPKEHVFNLLTEANCFLMPLRKSPVFRWGVSPNKLFDYMAAGRPIVFAVESSNNPVAKCDGGITADPDSPESIANAIRRIAQMPAHERNQMGKRSRRFVEENHSSSTLAAHFEAVCKLAMRDTSSH